MIGKVLTLSVLYFVQGLPYGFQDKFIPMYLRSTGLSHTKLSLMKLLLVPWLGKAAFGPLIDLRWSKWLWLLVSLAALTLVSFLGTFIDAEHFRLMCIWLFFLNLFSAFQDVSVDALALHILKECEMGIGNTAQVVGYKLGSLFGGGVLFWVHHGYGWSHLCYALTSLYIASMLVLSPMYVRKASKRKQSEDQNVEHTSGDVDSVPRDKSSPTDGGAKSSSNDEESYENVSRRRISWRESSESLLDTLEEDSNGESNSNRGEQRFENFKNNDFHYNCYFLISATRDVTNILSTNQGPIQQ